MAETSEARGVTPSVTPRCGFCAAVLAPGRARLRCDGACRQAAYRRHHQRPSCDDAMTVEELLEVSP